MPRSWSELVSPDDAVVLLADWIAKSPHPARRLAAAPEAGRRVLEALQVSTRSTLGAVAFHTGGVLVDDGWLRILGAGSLEIPRALDAWNGLGGARRFARGLLVADDAVGGFFAWFDEPRTVHYLAPDTLQWENLGLGYSDWLAWCFTDRLAGFYEGLRWNGFRDEVRALPGDRALHVAPPLFTKGAPIGERSRRAVPVLEHWTLSLELGPKLAGLKDGDQIVLRVED